MMMMAEARNKFLFEIKPSLFPEGELSTTEMILWEKFYCEKKENA